VSSATDVPSDPSASSFSVPVDYHTLANGLRVMISEDRSAPTAAVAVYYNIGFRIEPRERLTGYIDDGVDFCVSSPFLIESIPYPRHGIRTRSFGFSVRVGPSPL
jgi:hypothetical protein